MKDKLYNWPEYELLDSGDYEKMERFGPYVLIRPEPQALWPKQLNRGEWEKQAHAKFERDNSKKSHRDSTNENGGWQLFKQMPKQWEMTYAPLGLKLKLSCTPKSQLLSIFRSCR